VSPKGHLGARVFLKIDGSSGILSWRHGVSAKSTGCIQNTNRKNSLWRSARLLVCGPFGDSSSSAALFQRISRSFRMVRSRRQRIWSPGRAKVQGFRRSGACPDRRSSGNRRPVGRLGPCSRPEGRSIQPRAPERSRLVRPRHGGGPQDAANRGGVSSTEFVPAAIERRSRRMDVPGQPQIGANAPQQTGINGRTWPVLCPRICLAPGMRRGRRLTCAATSAHGTDNKPSQPERWRRFKRTAAQPTRETHRSETARALTLRKRETPTLETALVGCQLKINRICPF
jgi:hypothetical protein